MSINRIPTEIWGKVVTEFVDPTEAPQVLCNLAETCTDLHKAVNHEDVIWNSLYKRRFNAPRGVLVDNEMNPRDALYWRESYIKLHDLESRFRRGLYDRKIALTPDSSVIVNGK